VHKLIGYLEEFMSAGPLSIDIFNDPTKVKTFLDIIKIFFDIMARSIRVIVNSI